MEDPSQMQIIPQKRRHSFWGWGIVLGGVVLLLFWIFFWLNYFVILPLREWLPALSFLPRKIAIERIVPLPSITPTPLYEIGCPAAPPAGGEFCKKGREVFKNNQYIGWGQEVGPGTELRAIFSGTVYPTFTNLADGEKFATLYLGKRGRVARYIFKGNVIKSGEVEKGEVVGTASGEGILFYENLPLIFSYAREYDFGELEEQDFPIESAAWLRIQSRDFVQN